MHPFDSCHLFDPKTRMEMAKYTLSNAKLVDKHTALVMGCLHRMPKENDDDWYWRIIAEPAQGRTAEQNVDELQNFLQRHPPQPPTNVPPPEPEIVLSAMPDVTTEVEEEEEIVVVPPEDLKQYYAAATTTASSSS